MLSDPGGIAATVAGGKAKPPPRMRVGGIIRPFYSFDCSISIPPPNSPTLPESTSLAIARRVETSR